MDDAESRVHLPERDLDLERRWRRVGLCALAAALVAGGTFEIVATALSDVHPERAPLAGGPVVVFGVYGLAMVGFEAWYPRHRPGATLAPAPSGAAATAVRYSRFPDLAQCVVLALMSLTSAFGATYAALTGHPVVAVLGALLSVATLLTLVPLVRRRAPAAGLYLTSEGLEHHLGRVGWQLPWRDVAGAVATDRLEIVLEGRADVEQRRTTRWGRRPRPTATPGVVSLHPDTLGVDPVMLAAAISRGVVEPERRRELGTPASLEWGMLLRDP